MKKSMENSSPVLIPKHNKDDTIGSLVEKDSDETSKQRRQFLRNGGLLATGALVGTSTGLAALERISDENPAGQIQKNTEYDAERNPVVEGTLEYQLEHADRVDIKEASNAIFLEYKAQYEPGGRLNHDLLEGIARIRAVGFDKLSKPFLDEKLPAHLAYLIPLKESFFRDLTSKSGAIGTHQITRETAEQYGVSPSTLSDPLVSANLSARIFRDNFDKLGGDFGLAVYAYNAGKGLLGYRDFAKESNQSDDGYLQYLQDDINSTIAHIKEFGFHEITVREEGTLHTYKKTLGVEPEEVMKANNMGSDRISAGQELKIPFPRIDHAKRVLFNNHIQNVNYRPTMYAIFAVMKKYDYTKKLG